MENLKLKIDKTKCIHCGRCINDCSCFVLEFDENKIPKVVQDGEARCMKCQHCFAVCPTGALSIFDKNSDNSKEICNNHNPENVLNLIQSRRSIRHYKNQNLNKETFEKLKKMLPWIPTGCNDHRLHFTFIDDLNAMEKFKEKTYTSLKKLFNQRPFPVEATKFLRLKDAVLNGKDPIFRGAPHMVIVSSPVDAPCANIDPVIALSYFELYAQSLNVGTVWCGLAQGCLNIMPELVKELHLPDGYKPVYCMLFGIPDIQFKRITQPENYKISYYRKTLAKFCALLKNLKVTVAKFFKQ